MATAKPSEETKDSGTRRSSEKRSKYVVKPGHTVTAGATDADGNPTQKTYAAGEALELTDDQAAAMPWAVEEQKGGGRERSGQTVRLQRKLRELEEENKRLKAEAEAVKKDKDSKEHKQAIQSLIDRADNFKGRGEPEVGKVPPDALDAFDNRGADDDEPLSDEVGMTGLERAKSGGESAGTRASSPAGAVDSQPSTPKSGDSVAPGSSTPSKSKE